MVGAVGPGPAAVPGLEHRRDGAQELPVRIGLHFALALLGDHLQDGLLEPLERGQRGLGACGLHLGRKCLDDGFSVEAQHDLAEHAPEAQPRVQRKDRAARPTGQCMRTACGDAEVENGVHHAGHAHLRSGANRYEQRRRVADAEAPPGRGLELLHRVECLRDKRIGQHATVSAKCPVAVGADHERGRHADARSDHACEAGCLATEACKLGRVDLRDGVNEGFHARGQCVLCGGGMLTHVVSRGRPRTARMSSWNSNQMLCTESTVGLQTKSRWPESTLSMLRCSRCG